MTKDEALKMCLEYIETNAQGSKFVILLKEALAQPEPVAWEQFYPEMGKPQLIPPQRTWVGLTDGEVDKMILLMGFPPDWITENAIVKNIVRNLETKLKEKNT